MSSTFLSTFLFYPRFPCLSLSFALMFLFLEQLILVVESVSTSPRAHVTRLGTSPGQLHDLFDHLDLSLTSPDGLHLSEMMSSQDPNTDELSSNGGDYAMQEVAERKEFERLVADAKPPMLLMLSPHTSCTLLAYVLHLARTSSSALIWAYSAPPLLMLSS